MSESPTPDGFNSTTTTEHLPASTGPSEQPRNANSASSDSSSRDSTLLDEQIRSLNSAIPHLATVVTDLAQVLRSTTSHLRTGQDNHDGTRTDLAPIALAPPSDDGLSSHSSIQGSSTPPLRGEGHGYASDTLVNPPGSLQEQRYGIGHQRAAGGAHAALAGGTYLRDGYTAIGAPAPLPQPSPVPLAHSPYGGPLQQLPTRHAPFGTTGYMASAGANIGTNLSRHGLAHGMHTFQPVLDEAASFRPADGGGGRPPEPITGIGYAQEAHTGRSTYASRHAATHALHGRQPLELDEETLHLQEWMRAHDGHFDASSRPRGPTGHFDASSHPRGPTGLNHIQVMQPIMDPSTASRRIGGNQPHSTQGAEELFREQTSPQKQYTLGRTLALGYSTDSDAIAKFEDILERGHIPGKPLHSTLFPLAKPPKCDIKFNDSLGLLTAFLVIDAVWQFWFDYNGAPLHLGTAFTAEQKNKLLVHTRITQEMISFMIRDRQWPRSISNIQAWRLLLCLLLPKNRPEAIKSVAQSFAYWGKTRGLPKSIGLSQYVRDGHPYTIRYLTNVRSTVHLLMQQCPEFLPLLGDGTEAKMHSTLFGMFICFLPFENFVEYFKEFFSSIIRAKDVTFDMIISYTEEHLTGMVEGILRNEDLMRIANLEWESTYAAGKFVKDGLAQQNKSAAAASSGNSSHKTHASRTPEPAAPSVQKQPFQKGKWERYRAAANNSVFFIDEEGRALLDLPPSEGVTVTLEQEEDLQQQQQQQQNNNDNNNNDDFEVSTSSKYEHVQKGQGADSDDDEEPLTRTWRDEEEEVRYVAHLLTLDEDNPERMANQELLSGFKCENEGMSDEEALSLAHKTLALMHSNPSRTDRLKHQPGRGNLPSTRPYPPTTTRSHEQNGQIVCRNFNRGQCTYFNCQYLHDPQLQKAEMKRTLLDSVEAYTKVYPEQNQLASKIQQELAKTDTRTGSQGLSLTTTQGRQSSQHTPQGERPPRGRPEELSREARSHGPPAERPSRNGQINMFTDDTDEFVHPTMNRLHSLDSKGQHIPSETQSLVLMSLIITGIANVILQALLDTGALYNNFISTSVVNSNPALTKLLTKTVEYVILGDGKTVKQIHWKINLHVQFTDKHGKVHEARLLFLVLDMDRIDAIIGLPAIRNNLADFFTTEVLSRELAAAPPTARAVMLMFRLRAVGAEPVLYTDEDVVASSYSLDTAAITDEPSSSSTITTSSASTASPSPNYEYVQNGQEQACTPNDEPSSSSTTTTSSASTTSPSSNYEYVQNGQEQPSTPSNAPTGSSTTNTGASNTSTSSNDEHVQNGQEEEDASLSSQLPVHQLLLFGVPTLVYEDGSIRIYIDGDEQTRLFQTIIITSPIATILEVKGEIFSKSNLQPHEQVLFFHGQLLEDGQTLEQCGIQDNDSLELSLTQFFFIVIFCAHTRHVLRVSEFFTIRQILGMLIDIRAHFGYDEFDNHIWVDTHSLLWNEQGDQLVPSLTLRTQSVGPSHELTCTVRSAQGPYPEHEVRQHRLSITVRALTGREWGIKAYLRTRIRQSKQTLEDMVGAPVAHQRLFYKGRECPNHFSIEQCGIQDRSQLTLHLEPTGGAQQRPRGDDDPEANPSEARTSESEAVARALRESLLVEERYFYCPKCHRRSLAESPRGMPWNLSCWTPDCNWSTLNVGTWREMRRTKTCSKCFTPSVEFLMQPPNSEQSLQPFCARCPRDPWPTSPNKDPLAINTTKSTYLSTTKSSRRIHPLHRGEHSPTPPSNLLDTLSEYLATHHPDLSPNESNEHLIRVADEYDEYITQHPHLPSIDRVPNMLDEHGEVMEPFSNWQGGSLRDVYTHRLTTKIIWDVRKRSNPTWDPRKEHHPDHPSPCDLWSHYIAHVDPQHTWPITRYTHELMLWYTINEATIMDWNHSPCGDLPSYGLTNFWQLNTKFAHRAHMWVALPHGTRVTLVHAAREERRYSYSLDYIPNFVGIFEFLKLQEEEHGIISDSWTEEQFFAAFIDYYAWRRVCNAAAFKRECIPLASDHLLFPHVRPFFTIMRNALMNRDSTSNWMFPINSMSHKYWHTDYSNWSSITADAVGPTMCEEDILDIENSLHEARTGQSLERSIEDLHEANAAFCVANRGIGTLNAEGNSISIDVGRGVLAQLASIDDALPSGGEASSAVHTPSESDDDSLPDLEACAVAPALEASIDPSAQAASKPKPSHKVCIRDQRGDLQTFDCTPATTVSELRAMIRDRTGATTFRLFKHQRNLDIHSNTLEQCGLFNGEEVSFTLYILGSGPMDNKRKNMGSPHWETDSEEEAKDVSGHPQATYRPDGSLESLNLWTTDDVHASSPGQPSAQSTADAAHGHDAAETNSLSGSQPQATDSTKEATPAAHARVRVTSRDHDAPPPSWCSALDEHELAEILAASKALTRKKEEEAKAQHGEEQDRKRRATAEKETTFRVIDQTNRTYVFQFDPNMTVGQLQDRIVTATGGSRTPTNSYISNEGVVLDNPLELITRYNVTVGSELHLVLSLNARSAAQYDQHPILPGECFHVSDEDDNRYTFPFNPNMTVKQLRAELQRKTGFQRGSFYITDNPVSGQILHFDHFRMRCYNVRKDDRLYIVRWRTEEEEASFELVDFERRDRYRIRLTQDMTVAQLQDIAQDLTGLAPQDSYMQCLFVNLDNPPALLSSCGVKHNSKVMLFPKGYSVHSKYTSRRESTVREVQREDEEEIRQSQCGSHPNAHTFQVRNAHTGESYSFQLMPQMTIMQLKIELETRAHVPMINQRLIYLGALLSENGFTLAQYRVEENSVIFLDSDLKARGESANDSPSPPDTDKSVPSGERAVTTVELPGLCDGVDARWLSNAVPRSSLSGLQLLDALQRFNDAKYYLPTLSCFLCAQALCFYTQEGVYSACCNALWAIEIPSFTDDIDQHSRSHPYYDLLLEVASAMTSSNVHGFSVQTPTNYLRRRNFHLSLILECPPAPPTAEGAMLKITVRESGTVLANIHVPKLGKVANIYLRIYGLTALPPHSQILHWHDEELQPMRQMEDYRFEENDTVVLTRRRDHLQEERPFQISVRQFAAAQPIVLNVLPSDDVSELKDQISTTLGVPQARQVLMHKGHILNDDFVLQHYGIRQDSVIELRARLQDDAAPGIINMFTDEERPPLDFAKLQQRKDTAHQHGDVTVYMIDSGTNLNITPAYTKHGPRQPAPRRYSYLGNNAKLLPLWQAPILQHLLEPEQRTVMGMIDYFSSLLSVQRIVDSHYDVVFTSTDVSLIDTRSKDIALHVPRAANGYWLIGIHDDGSVSEMPQEELEQKYRTDLRRSRGIKTQEEEEEIRRYHAAPPKLSTKGFVLDTGANKCGVPAHLRPHNATTNNLIQCTGIDKSVVSAAWSCKLEGLNGDRSLIKDGFDTCYGFPTLEYKVLPITGIIDSGHVVLFTATQAIAFSTEDNSPGKRIAIRDRFDNLYYTCDANGDTFDEPETASEGEPSHSSVPRSHPSVANCLNMFTDANTGPSTTAMSDMHIATQVLGASKLFKQPTPLLPEATYKRILLTTTETHEDSPVQIEMTNALNWYAQQRAIAKYRDDGEEPPRFIPTRSDHAPRKSSLAASQTASQYASPQPSTATQPAPPMDNMASAQAAAQQPTITPSANAAIAQEMAAPPIDTSEDREPRVKMIGNEPARCQNCNSPTIRFIDTNDEDDECALCKFAPARDSSCLDPTHTTSLVSRPTSFAVTKKMEDIISSCAPVPLDILFEHLQLAHTYVTFVDFSFRQEEQKHRFCPTKWQSLTHDVDNALLELIIGIENGSHTQSTSSTWVNTCKVMRAWQAEAHPWECAYFAFEKAVLDLTMETLDIVGTTSKRQKCQDDTAGKMNMFVVTASASNRKRTPATQDTDHDGHAPLVQQPYTPFSYEPDAEEERRPRRRRPRHTMAMVTPLEPPRAVMTATFREQQQQQREAKAQQLAPIPHTRRAIGLQYQTECYSPCPACCHPIHLPPSGTSPLYSLADAATLASSMFKKSPDEPPEHDVFFVQALRVFDCLTCHARICGHIRGGKLMTALRQLPRKAKVVATKELRPHPLCPYCGKQESNGDCVCGELDRIGNHSAESHDLLRQKHENNLKNCSAFPPEVYRIFMFTDAASPNPYHAHRNYGADASRRQSDSAPSTVSNSSPLRTLRWADQDDFSTTDTGVPPDADSLYAIAHTDSELDAQILTQGYDLKQITTPSYGLDIDHIPPQEEAYDSAQHSSQPSSDERTSSHSKVTSSLPLQLFASLTHDYKAQKAQSNTPDTTHIRTIAAFNVNNLEVRTKNDPNVISDWLTQGGYDVAILTEVMLQASASSRNVPKIDKFKEPPPGYNQWWSLHTAKKAGVSVLVNKDKEQPQATFTNFGAAHLCLFGVFPKQDGVWYTAPTEEEHVLEGRVIIMKFNTFVLLAIYVPYGGRTGWSVEFRLQVDNDMQTFATICRRYGANLIIMGDLNVCPQWYDVSHPDQFSDPNFQLAVCYSQDKRDRHQQLLDAGDLVDTFVATHRTPAPDIPLPRAYVNGENYSWRGTSRFASYAMRNDLALVNASFFTERVLYSEVMGRRDNQAQASMGSDHIPIALYLRKPAASPTKQAQDMQVAASTTNSPTKSVSTLQGMPHDSSHTPLAVMQDDIGEQSSLQQLCDEATQHYMAAITKADEDALGPLREPFALPPDPAPEEQDLPFPESSANLLNMMERDPQDNFDDYVKAFDKQVHPDFLSHKGVRDFLLNEGRHVFLPTLDRWTGLKDENGDTIVWQIGWKEDLPARIKPRWNVLHKNKKITDVTFNEFNRLKTYQYRRSSSPWASSMVIADKATAPFVRLCGDYPTVNQYVYIPNEFVPYPKQELLKVKGYKIFGDIDMTNSFHQFKLDFISSERLSLDTPWGQYAPNFLPEGVACASMLLQRAVVDAFGEFREWLIIIFDNFLILAHDAADLLAKLKIVLKRARDRNFFMKFSKTFLGFSRCSFFGYEVSAEGYRMDDKRIQGIVSMPFPSNQKLMLSFLGAALFTSNFIPHFASLSAELHEMTVKSFNWDKRTWTKDYLKCFEDFKQAILQCMGLYFPDYTLTFILRTDASTYGVGAALFQATSEGQLQPLAFISKKWSPTARNWDTYQQECFACYYGVNQLEHILRGSSFILETDHANLQWMDQSQKPSVMRMRHYLQTFSFKIRHIKGTLNKEADLLSRLLHNHTYPVQRFSTLPPGDVPPTPPPKDWGQWHTEQKALTAETTELPLPLVAPMRRRARDEEEEPREERTEAELFELLRALHNSQVGHFGRNATSRRFAEAHPTIIITPATIKKFIEECVTCNKNRLAARNSKAEHIKTLSRDPSYRSKIGIDLLEMPESSDGNRYINVIVNFLSKRCFLYPQKSKDALECSRTLLSFFVREGRFEELHSDPGSDYTSNLVKDLTAWFGVKQVISIVDRHESNGVEGTNKKVLRHIRDLVLDHRCPKEWDKPECLMIVENILNQNPNEEIKGMTPWSVDRGAVGDVYLQLPIDAPSADHLIHQFVRDMSENLAAFREAAVLAHEDNHARRAKESPIPPLSPGSLVMQLNRSTRTGASKLAPKAWGPFQVMQHTGNDVHVKHCTTHKRSVIHIADAIPYPGPEKEAQRGSMYDNDEYRITHIQAYRGESKTRTTLEFLVAYEDNDRKWLPLSLVADTIALESFIDIHPRLRPLLKTAGQATKWLSDLAKHPCPQELANQTAYVDIRYFGWQWYASRGLPNYETLTYVVPAKYVMRRQSKGPPKMFISMPLLDAEYELKGSAFTETEGALHQTATNLPTGEQLHVIVTQQLVKEHPSLLLA